jgi:hypothetical protein
MRDGSLLIYFLFTIKYRRFELSHLAMMKTIMGDILKLEKTKMIEYGAKKWTIKIDFQVLEDSPLYHTEGRKAYFKNKLLEMTMQAHNVSDRKSQMKQLYIK